MSKLFLDGTVELHAGDCMEILKAIDDCSIDSCVTDPPYHLTTTVKRFGAENAASSKSSGAYLRASTGFMGKKWDGGDIAFRPELWAEVLRVLKPGGYVVAFSGSRTYHRMACAIEDAGFEIRDQLMWIYGTGFPKSLDISKAIDKAAGVEREIIGERKKLQSYGQGVNDVFGGGPDKGGVQLITAPATAAAAAWEGWGTALKPAHEPICLARKPIEGTNVENVLKWGTGALNIDACRVGSEVLPAQMAGQAKLGTFNRTDMLTPGRAGRWPANIVHDGGDEVLAAFPVAPGQQQTVGPRHGVKDSVNVFGDYGARDLCIPRGDSGSAARFFYSAKADSDDRLGSKHPTIKPVNLMQWLVRLVTPKGGLVLDLFAGTGTTGAAAWREGMRAVLIEREEEYQADIMRRMELCLAGPEERARASIKACHGDVAPGPLFE